MSVSILKKYLFSLKEGTDRQMLIVCNLPAGFLKQKAVPRSFIIKGKEAFRKKDLLNRDFTDSIYFQKFSYTIFTL